MKKKMKMKLVTASVFLLGLGLVGTAAGLPRTTSITPEMAQCIASCQTAGGSYAACWACCVQKKCPVD